MPSASDAFRFYFNNLFGAAAVYDDSVLPAIREAAAELRQAVTPARVGFQSEVQAALRADAAATAMQRQEITDFLAGLAGVAVVAAGTVAGLRAGPYQAAPQQSETYTQPIPRSQYTTCRQNIAPLAPQFNSVSCETTSY